MAKNWAQCMGYSVCKIFSLGQKLKLKKKKHVRNASRTTLELFFAKKQLKKTPSIGKMTSFQKSPKLLTMHGL